ncbi:hypothetical protein [Oceanobacillus saliphilus]|uniref:hypothetical protein n=1 Tax=Oceanobacillus saliphilus TaxID=2925834 RepID=UPI00201DE430|nr:hypothetical protein [Oceanobacillus saliphilus]
MTSIKPVTLHIIGDGEKKEELIDCAKLSGATVIYHGKIYDQNKKQQIFDCCHYGLNIMKDSVFVGLTMKSIDYFEAGLPIINNIRGDTWDLVEKHGIGINWEMDREFGWKYSYKSRAKTYEIFKKLFSVDQFYMRVKDVLKQIT